MNHLCPAVMVTFSAGRGTEETLDAVKILVSESWRGEKEQASRRAKEVSPRREEQAE